MTAEPRLRSHPKPDGQREPKRGFLRDIRGKLTLGAIIGAIVLEVTTKSISPVVADAVQNGYDKIACGGRQAMAEADRLSEMASADLAQAEALFGRANTLYAKAYDCGFPDAGLRLAFAHCTGLGTPKDLVKARGLVLKIESRHPDKRPRAGDVRKACGL